MTRACSAAEWRAAAHMALLIGASALASPASSSAPAPGEVFAPPPDRPLVLSRTVVRELAGGARIVATRRYRVTFHAMPDGWRIDGALIASDIDVPPELAAIAALERDRPDDGLFPIALDRAGRMVAEPGGGLGRDSVAGALGAARRLAGSEPSAMLTQLGAAAAGPGGGLTRWPEALFLPRGLNEAREEALALPDGSAGKVRVSLESAPAPEMATMGRAARTVVTEIAGTRRVAREEWTMLADATAIGP